MDKKWDWISTSHHTYKSILGGWKPHERQNFKRTINKYILQLPLKKGFVNKSQKVLSLEEKIGKCDNIKIKNFYYWKML